ncbi:MAG: hypothetical protein GY711_23790 [bacterium]|nr:hypothetical protein [bacterium]
MRIRNLLNQRVLHLFSPLVLLSLAPATHAQCQLDKLIASDGGPFARLGKASSLSGDRILLGSDVEAAYVFSRIGNHFQEEDKLEASGGTSGANFGGAVGLSDDWAVIGDSSDTTNGANSGAAYVFKRQGGTWVQFQKLTAPDSAAADFFGYSVAITGANTIVVGAINADGTGNRIGAAYAYARAGNNWNFQDKIEPSFSDAIFFGFSVSLDGNAAIIGSPDDDNGLQVRGAAYVFVRQGVNWVEQARLVRNGPSMGLDGYGTNVALSGDVIVIARENPGRTYVLERSGPNWADGAIIPVPAGTAISISGHRVMVGHNADDTMGNNAGVAILWERNAPFNWSETLRFFAQDPAPNDRFGTTVTLAGDAAVITAPFHDIAGNDAGAAYIFSSVAVPVSDCNSNGIADDCELLTGMGQDCNSNGIVDDCDISSGFSTDANENGVPDECEALGGNYCSANDNSSGMSGEILAFGSLDVFRNDLDLLARDLPQNQFGYYLMSQTQGFLPLFGGSQGNLCLAFPIVRFSQNILFSGPAGRMVFAPDFANLPNMATFLPGDSWNFQCWFRDVNPGLTSNTTDGVQVTFSGEIGPVIEFDQTAQAIDEVTAQFEVPILVSDPSAFDIVIPWSLGGTATDQIDWRVEETNPFIISPGAETASMTVTIFGDGVCELDETAIITLGAPTGATLGADSEHTITIRGAHLETEPNDTVGQANFVGNVEPGSMCDIFGNVNLQGSIDEIDVFRVDGNSPATLDYTLTPSAATADVVLSLTDEFGVALQGHNSGGAGQPESGSYAIGAGEIVLFHVFTSGTSTDYELVINGS